MAQRARLPRMFGSTRLAAGLRRYNAARYSSTRPDPMIESFADPEIEKLWNGSVSRRLPPGIQAVARRKLRMLDAAVRLDDLRVPPGNRLERLHCGRSGWYSIRINDRWRICFVWRDGGCADVAIVDYH